MKAFAFQLSDREKVRSMAYYLVVLADMYSVIGELIYADRIEATQVYPASPRWEICA